MLEVVIINQSVFTVAHIFFAVTNIPFRNEFKNVFVYYISNYTTYVTLNDTIVTHL